MLSRRSLIGGLIAAPVVLKISRARAQERTALTADLNISLPAGANIQSTIDEVMRGYDWAGFNVNISLSAGVYESSAVISGAGVGQTGSSMLNIIGADAANPQATVISASRFDAVSVINGGRASVSALKAEAGNGNCFKALKNGQLDLANVAVGGAGSYHFISAYQSRIYASGGRIAIDGGAEGCLYAAHSSTLEIVSTTLQLADGLAFAHAFLVCAAVAYVHMVDAAIPNKSARCPQADLLEGGIYSDGSQQPRQTYLPGSPGTVSLSGGATYNNSLT